MLPFRDAVQIHAAEQIKTIAVLYERLLIFEKSYLYMREIDVKIIEENVEKLFLKATGVLPEDLEELIKSSKNTETDETAKNIFSDMCENMKCAKELDLPVCQDTGMAVLFIEIGQDVHFTGGSLEKAINAGVKKAYFDGKLRCSVVKDPLKRVNTGDNTPALIHTKIVDGENVKLIAAPKGFGSENMSRIKMFTPAADENDIIDFVVETVKTAGANPCPPVVLGVGIGSDFEGVALLSKKALCRPVSQKNDDDFYKSLEEKMLKKVNELGIGAQGFGGDITALSVNIETAPTHIAGLPVAVNVGCHVTRHAEVII